MVSRITGSVGKGLAAITMDKEFQQKRREEMNRAPKDFGESLAKGGKGLLKVATLLAPPPTPVSRPRHVTHSLTSCSFVCRGSWAESRVSSPSLWRVSKLLPHCLLICFLGRTSCLGGPLHFSQLHKAHARTRHHNSVLTATLCRVSGAKKEGAAGFFKGIGKGLVGVVARPTGGIVDMASSTFQGIQR